jgi:hypothetical protein
VDDTNDGVHVEEVLQVVHVDLALPLRVDLLETQRRREIVALKQLLLDVVELESELDLAVDEFSQGVLASLVEILRWGLQGHGLPQVRVGEG